MNRLGYKFESVKQTAKFLWPAVIFVGKAGAYSSGASGKLTPLPEMLDKGESACSSNIAGKVVAYSKGAQGTSLTWQVRLGELVSNSSFDKYLQVRQELLNWRHYNDTYEDFT